VRRPSASIVVDAAVLIVAAIGRGSEPLLAVARQRALLATDRAVEESTRRVSLGMKRPDLLPILARLAEVVIVTPQLLLEPLLDEASRCLRLAPPSRNGSASDAHLLALAWEVEADIWSTDRDFAGAGVATWSTANLMRALALAG